ncbi:MAG: DNA mismatch repair protein MutS, partial [Actinomycetota bacterium]|nr:DNA mismatch repair protein MutS [Actinomycetota bacterium]
MSDTQSALSPMLREYRQTQAQHPGAVVLWRNGEFYEVYFETARLLGAELNLRVKPRPFGKEVVDFTGVPLANCRDIAHRLLQRGYRVVIVEQEDEPAVDERTGKKSIARSVARVLTPGTVVELDLLDGRANNYLAAVIVENGVYGLAYCDVSTGEFAATEFGGKRAMLRLEGELMRLLPSEVLVSDHEADRPATLQPARGSTQPNESTPEWAQGHITTWPAWRWDPHMATEALARQFDVATLAGLGLSGLPLATRAAGAVLQYVQETHRAAVAQIDHLQAVRLDATMFLDPQTQRNLELLATLGARKRGALIDLLDQTQTPMGARLLRRWLSAPLTDLQPLERRQDAVARYVE